MAEKTNEPKAIYLPKWNIRRTKPGEYYQSTKEHERKPVIFWQVRCPICRTTRWYDNDPKYFCSPECEKVAISLLDSNVRPTLADLVDAGVGES